MRAAVVPGYELLDVGPGIGLHLEIESVPVERVRGDPMDLPVPHQVGSSVLDTAGSPLIYIGVLER